MGVNARICRALSSCMIVYGRCVVLKNPRFSFSEGKTLVHGWAVRSLRQPPSPWASICCCRAPVPLCRQYLFLLLFFSFPPKGVPEAITACNGEVYVVTTKQTRFASALLDHAGERKNEPARELRRSFPLVAPMRCGYYFFSAGLEEEVHVRAVPDSRSNVGFARCFMPADGVTIVRFDHRTALRTGLDVSHQPVTASQRPQTERCIPSGTELFTASFLAFMSRGLRAGGGL